MGDEGNVPGLTGVRTLNPKQEFEVVKHVLQRERCLKRLTAECDASKRMTFEIGRLIDVLRIASIECLEAIDIWEQGQVDYPNVQPFLWNGVDYLMKMGKDMAIFDQHEYLTNWLSFPLTENPTIIPFNMLEVC